MLKTRLVDHGKKPSVKDKKQEKKTCCRAEEGLSELCKLKKKKKKTGVWGVGEGGGRGAKRNGQIFVSYKSARLDYCW